MWYGVCLLLMSVRVRGGFEFVRRGTQWMRDRLVWSGLDWHRTVVKDLAVCPIYV